MKKIILILVLLLNLSSFAQVQNQTIDSLQNLLSTANHDTTKINTLNELSWEFKNMGDYEKAMQHTNDALQLIQTSKFSKNLGGFFRKAEATTFNNIGLIYHNKGNYDKAFEFYLKSLKIAKGFLSEAKELSEKRDAQKSMVRSYNNIGNIHKDKGDFDKALEFQFKSLEIKEEIEDKKGMAASYNNIGIIYHFKGDYDKALEFQLKSLEIKEEIGDKNGMAYSYNNIGLIHWNKGDSQLDKNIQWAEYDKALEFHFKALETREEIGDKKGVAGSYNNIGLIYAYKDHYDKALEFYFKSLKIKEELEDKNGMATSYNNIGIIHYNKSDYDKALEFYFKSLKIKEEIGDKNGMAMSYDNIGLVFTEQKKYNEAREYLNKGLALSKAIGTKDWTKLAYLGLSQLDSTLGNWKAAYEYHKLYSVYKDSIFNEESSKQIADMQTKYETDKKEKENQILRQENELRIFTEKAEKEKIERRDNMQYSIILIVVIVLLSSILLLGKISVSPQVAEGLIFFVFLIFFEYILVLSDPYIDSVTGGAPGWKLLINSGIAALIFPMHSFFERLLKRRLTLKA
jgi:tetratricopeptide (TPR) repeat protein